MSPDDFTAPAPEDSRPVEYATFGRRLGAALLDSLVWIVGLGFFNPFVVAGGSETAAAIVAVLVATAWFNYFAICEWRWGQTIGKNATGIRVLPLEGGSLSWQAAAVRNLLRLVDLPLAMVGAEYLIVRGSPRRQRIGDRPAKTIVVRERGPAEAAVDGEAAGRTAPAGPSAGELFGEAAEALRRHPAAGSAANREEAAPDAGPSSTAPSARRPGSTTEVRGRSGPPARSWTARGFPFAAWDLRPTIIGLAVGLLAGGLIAPLLVVPFDPDLDSTAALLVAQGLLELTLITVAIGVASDARPKAAVSDELSLLGLRRFRPSAFGWLALGLVSYYAAAIAYAVLIVQPSQKDIARDLGLDAGVLAAIPVVALIVVLAPIAEEIFFRGMLFGGLRRRLATVPSAAISAVVFGGLHATTGITTVPPLIFFGFVLALLYERTGSLVPGMIAHALNNALALAAS